MPAPSCTVGSLDDPDTLRQAAEKSDGVIHLAFHHDFNDFAKGAEMDRPAIEVLGDTLAGSDRPLVVAGGILWFSPGQTLTEAHAAPPDLPRFSEGAALAFAGRGVRAVALRLPPSVHGKGDHGFVPRLIEVAVRRAFRHTRATVRTAGPPCTDSTRRGHSGLRWSPRLPGRSCTRPTTTECRCVRSPTPSARASACR